MRNITKTEILIYKSIENRAKELPIEERDEYIADKINSILENMDNIVDHYDLLFKLLKLKENLGSDIYE